MLHKGTCTCGQWHVTLECPLPTEQLNPRFCDCNYCKSNPSHIISHLNMVAKFHGGSTIIRQNGDKLANFYYCENCNQLLAIGCFLDETLRGAINYDLFSDAIKFGPPVSIQPYLLSATEKQKRWRKLWGELKGLILAHKRAIINKVT